MTIYLVEKLWIDPLENRDACGYNTIGYTTDETLIGKLKLDLVHESEAPWPLKYELSNNVGGYVPRYKITSIEELK